MPPLAPVSLHTDNVRSYHKDVEKTSRRAAEDLHEAEQAYDGALGLCFEYIAAKIGVDDEYKKRIDNARVAAARYHQLVEEDMVTTNKHMNAIHQEFNHVHGDIAALQAAVGITHTPSASGAGQSSAVQEGGSTTQNGGPQS